MLKARFRRILFFFAGVLLHLAWWDIFLPAIGLRALSRRTRRQRLTRIAVRYRGLAISLGGVMIKVGQFLSSRLDVLPREITDALSGLQDEVQPETFEDIRRVLEEEFAAPLETRFSWFDPIPVAAASIGQVHHARLVSRSEASDAVFPCPDVVVKVQRPNIQALVDTDLAALKVVGGWVSRYKPVQKRADVPALVEEFTRSAYEEVDYLHEGKNAETFAANFGSCADIVVPRVCWSHTTRRVLTLEDVQGIKITDYEAIEAAGISRAQVADRLFDTYLKQIFEDRFFHGDPHPGNLFVLPQPVLDASEAPAWKLVFVDFGIAGEIPESTTEGLRELLIAVGTQDAARLIRAYQQMHILLPNADLDLLERASARVFEEFWGKSTTELVNFRHEQAVEFAREFGELIYELPFQIPENLILLGRCLGILSGICTGLNKDFNAWTNIAPYAQKLVQQEAGSGFWMWLGELGKGVQLLLSLPRRADTLITRLEQGRLEVRNPDVRDGLWRLERSQRRVVAAILFAAFLLAGVQLYLGGAALLSGVFGAVCLLLLGWLIIFR